MKQTMISDIVRDFAATHDEIMKLLCCSEEKAWELAEDLCNQRYDIDLSPLHKFTRAQAYLDEKRRQNGEVK